jgi:2-polyprenyl-3-methyl-5-hydroxy-6-metoxy-1,4-benzoquinol methylase
MAISWTPETRPCPLCGSEAFTFLGRRGGVSHHARKGVETGIVRCRACHAVYPRPALLPEWNPYAEHEATDYFEAHEAEQKLRNGEWLARHAESLLGRRGRLLELGCGRGESLVAAARLGWSVRGVEMTPAFAAEAAGVDIELARVEDARSLSEQWDVILLAAILEHVYDPIACLKRVHDALVPGGLVFIDVPNECSLFTSVGNLYMRLRGREWVLNLSPTFSPYHVVGFCPASLRDALARCGLEVVALNTPRWQNEVPYRPGLVGRIERAGVEAALSVGAWIGKGAGITCWARRPAN